MNRSPLRRAFLLIPLVLVCFGLSPALQATDTGSILPNANTADGFNVLTSPSLTGSENSGFGYEALIRNTTGNDNTATGYGTLFLNTTGSRNTATGSAALEENQIGSDNTASGYEALFSNTTGSYNTAIGVYALESNTTGSYNTATGYQALLTASTNTTTGATPNDNTATGALALFSTTTGNNNTGTGVSALLSNTIGSFNTAHGWVALYYNTSGRNNTASGAQALERNQSGGNNTASGFSALFSNTAGANNTAEGFQALEHSTGSNNIAVGSNAGVNLTTGSNNIDIGALGVAPESATIRIGNGNQTKTFIAAIRGKTTVNANAVPVVIDSAGQLGTVSSSRRFKKEIKPMDKASEAILALRPVTFHYKTDTKDTPQFGLIAEEVAKVNPDLVVRDENGEIYTVRYDAVNAMLLNEFLKEHREVAELKSTVAEQRKGMEAMAAQLKTQASQIQKVSARLEVSKAAPQTVLNNQ